jgi:hypothetical protein
LLLKNWAGRRIRGRSIPHDSERFIQLFPECLVERENASVQFEIPQETEDEKWHSIVNRKNGLD